MTTAARGALAGCALIMLAAGCGLQRGPAASAGHLGGRGPGQRATTHHRTGHRRGGHRGTGTHHHGGPSRPAVAQCEMSQFRIRLDARAAGVAAGTSYLPVDFTDIGAGRCVLRGYPLVTVATGSGGKQIGAAAAADTAAAAPALVLAAGQSAHFWVRVADVTNLPAARCDPVMAAGLRVSLPGQPDATFLGHALTSCARTVSGTSVLTVEPFRPGAARPGTAQ